MTTVELSARFKLLSACTMLCIGAAGVCESFVRGAIIGILWQTFGQIITGFGGRELPVLWG